MSMGTRIPYEYRDANNYKRRDYFHLSGELSPEQVQRLIASLDQWQGGGEQVGHFVAQQLGLQHLGYGEWSSFPNENDDHTWHELWLGEIERVHVVGAAYDPEEFVAMFEAAKATGWDDSKTVTDWDQS